ncbi:S8 family serine peptidase [Adhaeribacter sp. BT258]|uniref:S8 family serine peptidase n=1 Tax=Adhaeribacter terrigena TaxID=2793070 RepID=A0ABS1BWP1_9BACT|nr:S8 family serine peptidase [Adhaeribacter terrigena]
MDRPAAIGADSSGNVIIGGFYTNQPGNTELSLISLNSSLRQNWAQNINITPGEDKIADLFVNQNGDIYVTGHNEESPGYFKAFVAKYDNAGNQLWLEHYQSPRGGAYGKKISMDNNGDLVVAGVVISDANKNFLTMKYSQDGEIRMAEEFDSGNTDIASSLALDNQGNIYISGTSSSPTADQYNTVKYSTYYREINPVTSSKGVEYVDNDVIIKFNPTVVKVSAIDNLDKTYGKLSDFVQPSAIQTMYNALDQRINFGSLNTVKVFPNLTTTDNYSISRLGDTVAMPPFWATFVIELPDKVDETEIAAKLSRINPTIEYAQLNYIVKATARPNDNLISVGNNQLPGLIPNATFKYAHIKMEQGWDVEVGSEDIKVGVIDSGINWEHEDFGKKTGSKAFIDSKIKGGWDYRNKVHVANASKPFDDNGHGTAAAGIIGALRNNTKGVAGIAGGDMAVSNSSYPNGNSGVQLFSLRILKKNGSAYSYLMEAIVDGARYNPSAANPGFGLHILNLSLAAGTDSAGVLEEAIKFCFRNSCTVVAASGNYGNLNVAFQKMYPASFYDPWVIKVGYNDATGKRGFFSNYGHNLDLIAPGTNDLYTCLSSANNNAYVDKLQNGKDDIEGTSFAAPHVTGVAGLMQSHFYKKRNKILASEDIEFLIQKYATDINVLNSNYFQYYDDLTGHGRLNADSVLKHIEFPKYDVLHDSASMKKDPYTINLYSDSTKIELRKPAFGLPAGEYIMDVYDVTITKTHSIGNATVVNSWVRNASSNLFRRPLLTLSPRGLSLEPEPNVTVFNVTNTQAMVAGNCYFVKKSLTGQTINKWIPFDPYDQRKLGYAAYSLHVYDANATGVADAFAGKNSLIKIYPNPTTKNQTIQLSLKEAEQVSIKLFDIQGREIRTIYKGIAGQNFKAEVDLNALPNGMYLYRVETGREVVHSRFVKN